MHHPTERISHTTAFVTPLVEHWLERYEDKMATCVILLHETEFVFDVSLVYNRLKVVSWNDCK